MTLSGDLNVNPILITWFGFDACGLTKATGGEVVESEADEEAEGGLWSPRLIPGTCGAGVKQWENAVDVVVMLAETPMPTGLKPGDEF